MPDQSLSLSADLALYQSSTFFLNNQPCTPAEIAPGSYETYTAFYK